jgi:hypothetical protein
MKAILIDPFKRDISDVEFEGETLAALYKLIDCTTVTAVSLTFDDQVVSLFLDDEGLFVSDQRFWSIFQYPEPLAGRAVILGFDASNGESLDTPIDAARVSEEGVIFFESAQHAIDFMNARESKIALSGKHCGLRSA